jgi:rfaE bifunctional protein nucleotidyltransferase chain/domain
MYPVSDESAFTSPKMLTLAHAAALVSGLKREGKTVGMCHGGFDLLHAGHIKHFESAKLLCDVLIVSVTSDAFVRKRKGNSRPVFSETIRAYMIAGLSAVDYVVVTDYERATDVIAALRPTLYIKGEEYRNKSTPGITSERQAILAVGGRMEYTADPKLGTSEIIGYIQSLSREELLLVCDRDGTLIVNDDFFGRDPDWRERLTLNAAAVSVVSALQRKYPTTMLVVSNQSGVARKYFGEDRVREINARIDELLKANGVTVTAWRYCTDVDAAFAAAHPEIGFDPVHVLPSTTRKPAPDLVADGLSQAGKRIGDFRHILVLGNGSDDRGLAERLGAGYIDVTGRTLRELMEASARYLEQTGSVSA